MLCSRNLLLGMAVLLIAAAILPGDSGAIPAFARRYRQSCTTCHSPFPHLRPYGDEFAGNGFIIPEEERDRDYVTAGDDLLWLNRDFPLAVRFDAYALYDQAPSGVAGRPVEYDLQIPWGLKLLSGGTLYRNIGYYFYFYMSERGEVAGIEDAYVHFNDLGGLPLDLMVGQFQTSDPLIKRELRLTFEDYEIYKRSVGDSEINLTYDRGLMATYGLSATGTDLVAMLVNGNGKDEAGADRKFDGDDFKSGGLRVSQALGAVGSVGGFVYIGRERDQNERENEVLYWGPDLSLGLGPLELTAQYLVRRDDNPLFLAGRSEEVETTGIVAQLILAPQRDRSRHYVTLLYNQVETDLRDMLPEASFAEGIDYETLTLAVTHLLARNLRLTVEYTRDLELERNRMVLGLVTAF